MCEPMINTNEDPVCCLNSASKSQGFLMGDSVGKEVSYISSNTQLLYLLTRREIAMRSSLTDFIVDFNPSPIHNAIIYDLVVNTMNIGNWCKSIQEKSRMKPMDKKSQLDPETQSLMV